MNRRAYLISKDAEEYLAGPILNLVEDLYGEEGPLDYYISSPYLPVPWDISIWAGNRLVALLDLKLAIHAEEYDALSWGTFHDIGLVLGRRGWATSFLGEQSAPIDVVVCTGHKLFYLHHQDEAAYWETKRLYWRQNVPLETLQKISRRVVYHWRDLDFLQKVYEEMVK